MPLVWNLKKWLAVNHDIYRASELQSALIERVGIQLSLQAISALLNNKPNALRVQTIQAICDAFACKMSDFCDVVPNDSVEQQTQERQRMAAGTSPARLYGSKKGGTKSESVFPDPYEYKNRV